MNMENRELIYEVAPDLGGGVARLRMFMLGLFGLAAAVGGIALAAGLDDVAGAACVGVAIVSVLVLKWRARPTHAVLSIDGRRLFVRSGKRSFDIDLRDLDAVSLERREIQRVQDGSPLVVATMAINTTVGPSAEVVRILLEGATRSFLLTEEFQPHMMGVEGMGRVRRFLRSHGWTPAEEREAAGEDATAPRSEG